MSKRRYDSEQAMHVIADQAAILFAMKGYAGTSIDELARASGYSKGHIYYYFKNKENLFLHLALKGMADWAYKWERASANSQTATEKLYKMGEHVMNNYETPLLKAGQELAADPNTKPETVQQLYGLAVTPLKAYTDILLLGIANGEFPPLDVEHYALLLGAWLGGLCSFIKTLPQEQLAHMFRDTITIFLREIQRDPRT
ncbi:TetR/AcrR family transcriptional regulator [Paenibacillus azoreducens]|uniref:TetR family transcriptional regulator n=1 Tax=Paenibacillus azoreducens TaxID=116718 RepID=A0A919YHE4_9BACL|nr:TetR/AcrR family transcriptional regulator [Paenibacillus azoreducens]GIO49368.1 TetR family transcriptional regulator [Paenibacillus azoreducens]